MMVSRHVRALRDIVADKDSGIQLGAAVAMDAAADHLARLEEQYRIALKALKALKAALKLDHTAPEVAVRAVRDALEKIEAVK